MELAAPPRDLALHACGTLHSSLRSGHGCKIRAETARPVEKCKGRTQHAFRVLRVRDEVHGSCTNSSEGTNGEVPKERHANSASHYSETNPASCQLPASNCLLPAASCQLPAADRFRCEKVPGIRFLGGKLKDVQKSAANMKICRGIVGLLEQSWPQGEDTTGSTAPRWRLQSNLPKDETRSQLRGTTRLRQNARADSAGSCGSVSMRENSRCSFLGRKFKNFQKSAANMKICLGIIGLPVS